MNIGLTGLVWFPNQTKPIIHFWNQNQTKENRLPWFGLKPSNFGLVWFVVISGYQ